MKSRSCSTPCPGVAIAAVLALLGGCATEPAYERPEVPVSASFKEAGDWLPAAPADALERGPWWTLFEDAVLNDLAARVEVSNQNVAVAVAAYDLAHATLREQRAALFPSVTVSGGIDRGGGGAARDGSSFDLMLAGSWQPDLFGRLKSALASSQAGVEASAGDLASARLAAQGQLVAMYTALRLAEAQDRLLSATIASYERNVTITRNRYNAGVVPRTDVLQAETQLANARADGEGYRRQRAAAEHAIAVLVGEAPGNFAIAPAAWLPRLLAIPVGVPSTLLQRRPDIAAAERRVAAANAQIGVARSAYYPNITLSASAGLGASTLANLVSSSATLWSLGVAAAQSVLNAGATDARVAEARAATDQAVARYRQVVLTAFQDVEDQLVALRVLDRQIELRRQASEAADAVEQQFLNRYRVGLVNFSDVVSAQTTALSARRALQQALADRQTAAVALIQALGGGWNPGNR